MAQFTLTWDNTDELASTNSTGQRLSYRKRATAGAWSVDGFTPNNDLATNVLTAISKILDDNTVWQFKIDTLCTNNGPVSNDNGYVDQIGFAEIVPTLAHTHDTATITLDVSNKDISKAFFVLKKTSDNSIIKNVTVNRSGTTISYVATGLTAVTDYYWEVTLYATINGVEVNSAQVAYIGTIFGSYPITTDAATHNYAWVKDTSVCEEEGGFIPNKTITGLADPIRLWYDATTDRVYVADLDEDSGNVYWFNPTTAVSKADFTFSSAINDIYYGGEIDTANRRIYFVGENSGGLKVYNIDTDTVSTVACGTDGTPFNRISLLMSETKIYIYHAIDHQISIIDRATLVLISTINISAIPSHTILDLGGASLFSVADEIWVSAGSGASISDVVAYNADFTSCLASIAIPGSSVWESGRYWSGGGCYDPVSGHYFHFDIGSNQRVVIDVATKTILDRRTVNNRQGKTTCLGYWQVNPITNELYHLQTLINSTSDASPIQRTYLEDRATFQYKKVFEGQANNNLVPIVNSDKVMGQFAGLPKWSGNPVYETDGSITILDTSSGTGGNTGIEIVTRLKQIDHAAADAPTGLTKANDPSDPDYIAPVTNLVACPVVYTTDCPLDKATTFDSGTGVLDWEFSIPTAVKNNPAIAKIRVYALNTGTMATEGVPTDFNSPFGSNYFSGQFTGLGGSNYSVKIVYLDGSGVSLNNC